MFKIKQLKLIYQNIIILMIMFSLTFALLLSNKQPVFSQSITGLNAEISSLRSRINSLESEVRRLKSRDLNFDLPTTSSTRETQPDTINNPPAINNQVIGKSDPLYKRLATLLIELKEDVNKIETRLVVLEEKHN